MKFDALDTRMRGYETLHDERVPDDVFIVARVDGRSFTRLTKQANHYTAPFDERIRDCMIATLAHLMDCGFRIAYGYTQSDEISILLHLDEDTFQRKLRKLVSVIAGEASAAFSLALGTHGAFDARISQLPTEELVVDYFRWRQADASRNALNAHGYWTLRKQGVSAAEAHGTLAPLTVTQKQQLLRDHGIEFDAVPSWQTYGIGMWWDTYAKDGHNPHTGEDTVTTRRRLHTELALPHGDAYGDLVRSRIAAVL